MAPGHPATPAVPRAVCCCAIADRTETLRKLAAAGAPS